MRKWDGVDLFFTGGKHTKVTVNVGTQIIDFIRVSNQCQTWL